MEEEEKKIALGWLQRFGIIKTKTLLSYAGNLDRFFSLSDKELASISKTTVQQLKKFDRKAALTFARKEIDFIAAKGIRFYYFQDKNYPASLKFCADCPIILYTRGNIDFNQKNIAIVGTRKATNYGKKITAELIRDLAGYNVQIISGLAHGIDKEAHEGALANQLSTIGVLGHGLDMIYPAAHRPLAEKMVGNGGLITEFMSKTPGDPSHFPQRNRIVAGLSDATIVIESAERGGSLITARLANEYNREVFAFPGGVDQSASQGCNNLIKQNKAHLISSAQDVIELMEWKEHKPTRVVQENIFESLTVDEDKLVRIIRHKDSAIHIDLLCKESGLTPNELSLHLFNLEMRGTLQSLPGKMYQLKG